MSDSFEEKIELYLSGEMSSSDCDDLVRALQDEPGLVDLLLDHIEMDMLLDDWAAVSSVPASEPIVNSVVSRRPAGKRWWRNRIAVAVPCYVVLCLIAMQCGHWFSNRINERQLLAQSDRPEISWASACDTDAAVAKIGITYNLKWKNPLLPHRDGELIFPGILAIDKGAFSLSTIDGGELVVEGPAALVLDAEGRLNCRSGRFYFRFPPNLSPREIEIPGVTLRVDTPSRVGKDTCFAVKIDESSTEVHLFHGGTLQMQLHVSGRRITLPPNGAVSVDRLEGMAAFASAPHEFTDIMELKQLHRSRNWECYDHWKAEMESVQTDPSLVFLLDLDDGPNPGMMPGHGPRTSLSRQWGCMRAPGRFKINNGLLFFWAVDSLDMSVPVRLDTFTMTTSVRMTTGKPQHQSLFASEGLCWEINPDGVMILEINDENQQWVFRSTESIPSEIRGCWLHLALVVDPANKVIKFYLDGREILSDNALEPQSIWFGKSGFGGWTGRGRTRFFSGCLDEFRLYDRVLSPLEIERIASKP